MTLTVRAATLKKELSEALVAELEVAKKSSMGDKKNELKNGVKARKKGEGFIYEFEDLTGMPPEEGVQVTFSVGEKSHKGRYLGEVNARYLFEVDSDLGQKVDVATAISDPLFLLEKQIEILKSDAPFENQVALSSLGLADYMSLESLKPDISFMNGLNSLQASALDVVANKSVTYIWGPPGTGKTTTMGSIVAALASSGQRVLLVSNTNLAIDTALERCLDRFVEHSPLTGGQMLRLGTMVKPELIKKYSEQVDLDSLVEQEVEPLRREIDKTSASLAKKKDELSDLKEQLREYEQHFKKANASEPARQKLAELTQDAEKLKADALAIPAQLRELQSELSEAESKSTLSRMFGKGRNPGQIRLDINTKQSKKDQAEKSYIRISIELSNLENEIASIDAAAKSSMEWLSNKPDSTFLSKKADELGSLISIDEKKIEQLQEEISEKRKEIMGRAKVISCTAYRPLLDKDILGFKFDCVVVDEASMLQLPLYYCAAALSTARIVVAGDFRQLPPIVRVGSNSTQPTPAELKQNEHKEILVSNPFMKSGVIARSKMGQDAPELIALRDQYRMREPISELISSTFYPEHTLRTVAERTDKSTPWGNQPFIIFDTSNLEPESSTVNNKSRRNIIHALVIEAITEQLFNDGWELDATAEKSFGVISPYAKQSSLIENLVMAKSGEFVRGGVSTVHRFQGNERDIMIIDVTKVSSKSEPELGPFIGNPDPLSPSNAMWNVAISRARQHVILVTDMPTMLENGASVISQMVTKMQKSGVVIDAASVLDAEVLGASAKTPKSDKGSISWYSGEGFYKAFERDLSATQSKVFLASPFTTDAGTSRWMQTFRDLRAKDVEIVGFTKPVGEKDSGTNSEKIHKELEGVFKELRPVSKMHEKLAVFDQRIVWLGSLNILSHKNSTEIMVRIDSPDFAASLLNEYQNQRPSQWKSSGASGSNSSQKEGEKCSIPGCSGTLIMRQAGISKNSGRRYEAFLGCTNWKSH